MKNNEASKGLVRLRQSSNEKPKETEVLEVVAVPDLTVQISPVVEQKLKEIGVTIEGLQIIVTVPGKHEGEPSFKRNIFTDDPNFEEASAIKFFETNGKIFLKVTKKPIGKAKKGTTKYYEIVPNEDWGATAQGYINGNDTERLKEYGLTGQE
jgi:hypothetical protein